MKKNTPDKESKPLVLTGGSILTMAEDQQVEAVTVENGRIHCAGTREDCRRAAGDDFQQIDLAGRCLLPGFIDAHYHMMMLGMCNIWCDISYPKVKSIDDLIETLSRYAESLPQGVQIRGFGFDQRALKEERHPVAADLDRVATNRAVQIMHKSGHCNIANNYLLKQIGVGPETIDPPGGAFGRDAEGHPNGPMFDSAADYLAGEFGVRPGEHGPNIHMPDSPENLQNIIRVGQDITLAAGITTINDVQVTSQEMESYLQARDSGLLNIRIVLSYLSNYLDDIKKMGLCSTFGDEQLSLGPLKLYADGTLLGGTALLSTGYLDSGRNKGYMFHQPEVLKALIVSAHKYGLQTMTHTQGDAAIEYVLEAVEQAQRECPREDVRHRIEHCGLPTEEQVKRIADLKIWPVPQPQHVHASGEGVVKAVGKIGENYSPYGWFTKYGVPIVLSSDAPVAYPNPLEAVYACVTRKTIQGNVVGSEQKISLEESLKGYTINAAKAVHKEDEVGSIETGKLADFAILDCNPFEVAEEELKDIRVMETWIGGKKVFPG